MMNNPKIRKDTLAAKTDDEVVGRIPDDGGMMMNQQKNNCLISSEKNNLETIHE
jgi:hypothetical protein